MGRRKNGSAIAIKLHGKLKLFLRVTRDTAKEKSGYILEKNLPSFILSQETQHIIHVKDIRRLRENQRAPMLPNGLWCPSSCLPPFLALADWWTPGLVWLPKASAHEAQQRAGRETIDTPCTARHVTPPSHTWVPFTFICQRAPQQTMKRWLSPAGDTESAVTDNWCTSKSSSLSTFKWRKEKLIRFSSFKDLINQIKWLCWSTRAGHGQSVIAV